MFRFDVDRFELDGNVLGPLDGTPDLIDEFDDGVLDPWVNTFGTAAETAGVLIISNPGATWTPSRPPLSFDLSDAKLSIGILDNGGDFVATAVVTSFPMEPGDYSKLVLAFLPTIDPQEQIGIAIGNLTPEVAAYIPGCISGPAVGQFHFQQVDSVATFDCQSVSRNLGEVTLPLVLKVAFDDESNSVTASFSLDGGATFESPFIAQQPSMLPEGGEMEIILGSDPASLQPGACGNGIRDTGEGCDDGNISGGDGCDSECYVETCFTCAGEPSICAPVVTCTSGDGCCPDGCESADDDDCPEATTTTLTSTTSTTLESSTTTTTLGVAGQHMKIGKLLLVKNPKASDPSKRKIVYKVKEKVSTNIIVGDPVANGAKLKIKLDDNTDCYDMPASGWSAISTLGFKYKDPRGGYGPVKVASIKKTRSGTFLIKAKVMGRNGPITVVPPDPGIQADTSFRLGDGDEYCSTFGGTMGPNNDKTFKAKNADAPTACNVHACSPSGAFLGVTSGVLGWNGVERPAY